MTRGQFPSGDDMSVRFRELVEQARLADTLGFSSLTKGSHYSAHPYQDFQQFPFLARMSAEAPNLRLNFGIVLVPLHKPLDVAEQLATIDVMSGGRVIFGAGLGYRDVEFEAFGTEQGARVKRFEENLTAIRRLWTEETVDMAGGANADSAIRRAARLGDCWYVNPHNRIDTIQRQTDVYRAALDKLGKPFPLEFPCRREVFVAASHEEAMRLARPHLEGKYEIYRSWGQDREMPQGDDLGGSFEDLARDRFLIGTADAVAEGMVRLSRLTGINHLIMSIQWAGMPQSLVIETMHRLAEEVFPKVRHAA
jgi:alkanesulfonate monooxygenase SsuD/methylene tetrahydromethanopterin reductase-like flavin-dependent oxidoreductase (luciferase family)